ncbi:MAG TPA: hypothetical protein DCY20_11390 [Firmicutes bacterium]|nr:hypothetical protein [Bacillota bacterium]
MSYFMELLIAFLVGLLVGKALDKYYKKNNIPRIWYTKFFNQPKSKFQQFIMVAIPIMILTFLQPYINFILYMVIFVTIMTTINSIFYDY